MWKKLLLISTLCYLCLQMTAENVCNTICLCEESDEKAGFLAVSCVKLDLTTVPSIDVWPSNIYSMDVSRNNLTQLKTLEHNEVIRVMKLQYCELKSISPRVFEGYPFLKKLDISQNILSILHKDSFLGLEELNVLDMSDNNIRKLPDNLFDSLAKLEELKLSGNPLCYLETNTFKQLDNLIRLDISNIGLHSLNDGIFHFMANLQILDLSSNKFEEVPDSALKSAPKLKELYFNENKIKDINEISFKDLTQLELLELNELSDLIAVKGRAFSTLKSLKVLKLTYNGRLNYIDASAFDGIYNPADINSLQLKVFSLRNNDLSTLDAHILPWCQIQTLDLQGNPWFCDCFMKWMINCSFPAELSADLKCRGPISMKGRNLKEIPEDEYVCLHQMAPNSYSQAQVRTVAAITGLVLALVVSIVVVLFVKRRKIKAWWSLRRRGQGAIYYVKAHTNPTDNAEL